LQNPVGFAQALAVFRPTGCKTAVFKRLLLQNSSFATTSNYRTFLIKKQPFFSLNIMGKTKQSGAR
jgi:hypothetical protein